MDTSLSIMAFSFHGGEWERRFAVVLILEKWKTSLVHFLNSLLLLWMANMIPLHAQSSRSLLYSMKTNSINQSIKWNVHAKNWLSIDTRQTKKNDTFAAIWSTMNSQNYNRQIVSQSFRNSKPKVMTCDNFPITSNMYVKKWSKLLCMSLLRIFPVFVRVKNNFEIPISNISKC